jgi:murein endopeptidase
MSKEPKEMKRAKAAMALSKKLEAATKAMGVFVNACVTCGDPYPNADDTRVTLRSSMNEYSGWLESVYKAAAEKGASS